MTAAVDGEWDGMLRDAFEVLLGRPLSDYDPTVRYALYLNYTLVDETLPAAGWLNPRDLADSEPVVLPNAGNPIAGTDERDWRFDLSRSLVLFDEDSDDAEPIAPALFADLRAAGQEIEDLVAVRGTELGAVLERHGLGSTPEGPRSVPGPVAALLRVATDGSLLDALRVATFTHFGPEHLCGFDEAGFGVDGAEPKWERRLAVVRHPALRDHLRMHCLTENDSRAQGLSFYGADQWPILPVERPKSWSQVAGWGDGESVSGFVVVGLPTGAE